MQPYNYNIDVAKPFASAVQGYAIGQQVGQDIQAAQAAPQIAQQQQMARDALSVFANKQNPTAQDYQRVLLYNPSLKDQLGEGWKAMSAEQRKADFGFGAQVLAATAGGKVDIASQLLTERAKAARNSGDTQQADLYDTYAKLVTVNPAAAERGIGLLLSAVDPDTFDKTYKAIEDARVTEKKLPSEIATAEAEVDYKKRQTQRLDEMTANEVARLGLDADEFALEVNKYADTLAGGEAPVSLSVGMEKVVDDATTAAVTASARAAKARQLSLKFKGLEGGGLGERLFQAGSELLSGERDLIRTEAAGLLNQEVVSMLPPGPATDRDITIMREGVPSAYSDPAKVRAFLDAMARTADRAARSQAARASWVSQNGNAGVLKRDIVVEGREVPKGTSFVEFMRILGEADARAAR